MLSRYLHLFLYSFLAFTLIEVFRHSPTFKGWLNKYLNFTKALPEQTAIVVAFLLGVAIFSILIRFKVLHEQRLNKPSGSYPPLYWALYILPAYYLVFYEVSFEELQLITNTLFSMNFLSLLLGVFIGILYFKGAYFQKLTKEEIKGDIDWLKSEQAISEKDHLKFGRELYVNRIISRLKDDDYANQIALCGKYGSGKSSISDCTAKELQQYGWGVVKLESWGRDIEKVNSQILASIVDKAAEYVDVSCLDPLPSNYQSALKAKGGWLSAFNSIISNHEKDYLNQLTLLDEVFKIINKKVLIVLEDIDRNDNAGLYCSEVGSLLDKLRGFNNFRFIVSVGYNSQVADVISRVCDYREDLASENFLPVIESSIHKWVKRASDNNVFLPKEYSEKLSIRNIVYNAWGSPTEQLHVAINILFDTPRVCKQVLRRVDEIWQVNKLIGEIDLVDLILLQLIREVAPGLFVLIEKFERNLINGISDPFQNTERHQKEVEKLKTVFQDCLNTYDNPSSLSACMGHLFPAWPQFETNNFSGVRDGDQKFASRSATISYMNRFVKEQLGEEELSDQSVIRQIIDYGNYTGEPRERFKHTLVSLSVFDMEYFERFKAFVFNFWVCSENKFNDRLFVNYYIDVIRCVKASYSNGNRFSLSPSVFDGGNKDWCSLQDVVEWASSITKFNHVEILNKKLLLSLMSGDLHIARMYLRKQGANNYIEFQDDLITALRQSIQSENNDFLYSSTSFPSDLAYLCGLLSNVGNKHGWSTGFDTPSWAWLFELLLTDGTTEKNQIRNLAIFMMFFLSSEDYDRNKPVIDVVELSKLDSELFGLLKSQSVKVTSEELAGAYDYLLPIEAEVWLDTIKGLPDK